MRDSSFSAAVQLTEDALGLVRKATAWSWLIYLLGAVPFFGLLSFEATDLVQSPFAADHLLVVSGGLALFYVQMHACQSIFARQLNALVTETPVPLTLREMGYAFRTQAIIQSTKLVIWPCAVLLLIPHAAVSFFYQHALATAGPEQPSLREVIQVAAKNAAWRQVQSFCFLSIVFVLRFLVWANLTVLVFALPSLWKSVTGMENAVTRQPFILANPTTWVVLIALTYLALDPLVKAACVLRQLQRQSESSGFDLRLRLRRLRQLATVGLLAVVLIGGVPSLRAAQPQKELAATPSQMQEAIEDVFHDRTLSWDLPVVRKKKKATKNGFFTFITSNLDRLRSFFERCWSTLRTGIEWLRHLLQKGSVNKAEATMPVASQDAWALLGFFVLLIAIVIGLVWWRRNRKEPVTRHAAPLTQTAAVDLSHDLVQADDQSQDEWLRLAEQYRRSGNLRLAVRALYLSSLSALAQANLIAIARGKSNAEYLRELQRRGKRLPAGSIVLFRKNLGIFEAAWYGDHVVTEDGFRAFESDLSSLRGSL